MRIVPFALTLQLAFAPLAQAKEILFRSQGQSAEDFAGVKLARPDTVGYDEYQAERLVSREMKENLTAAYLRAQDHFLKSEISQIETDWQDVAAYAYKADWGPTQREMIQTSYMRLAQLASTPEETKRHLRSALEYDSGYTPDSRLFPPPLVEQYRQMRKGQNPQTVSTQNWKGFTILFVNGIRYDLETTDAIELGPGTKRVTFISPTYAQVGRVLEASELASFQPQRALLPQAAAGPGDKIKTPSRLTPELRGLYEEDASIERIAQKPSIKSHNSGGSLPLLPAPPY
jgi:hypothetical protein